MKTFKEILAEAKLRLKDKKPMLPNKQYQANELVLGKDKAGYARALKDWKRRIADKKQEIKGLENRIEWMEGQIPVAAALAKKGEYHEAFMALWLDEFGF